MEYYNDMKDRGIDISISSLKKSPKIEGKYEKDIILKVAEFFQNQQYNVREHISLNIAWGSVLYEIDLLAIKEQEITIVEVKSKKDKLMKAKKQIDRLRGLIDYSYIASDLIINQSYFRNDVGILFVEYDKVIIIRNAQKINEPMTKDILMKLRKKCLIRLLGSSKIGNKIAKQNLVNLIIKKYKRERAYELKTKVRDIVFCSNNCTSCSINNNLHKKIRPPSKP